MCEYCGCQDVESIGELIREHDAIIGLIRQVREHIAAGRLDQVASACWQISLVLRPHTIVEEEALFPAMATEFPDHMQMLLGEHRRIEEVLRQVCAADAITSDITARLNEVLHLLREHIFKEQDGVFPAAMTTLNPEDWDRMDAVRARVGNGPAERARTRA